MRRKEFVHWLMAGGQKESSTKARAANCATVERCHSDLDALSREGFCRLLEEFETKGAHPVRHRVPINGNPHTGTATLRSALNRYFDFRFDPGIPVDPGTPPVSPPKAESGSWPEWESPSDEDSLRLAQVLTRHARFLHPEIVRALVEDNERHADRWRTHLGGLGVTADAYLWQRSPCAFPGVRRYAGSAEIAEFRGHKPGDGKLPPGAAALDDNDYPKHLWSFLFRGKPFQKHGPRGYNLAHLVDHKDHNNRAAEHFDLAHGISVEGRLHGLFSCPTNTVFVPVGLLKPTDFHPSVRHLFILKAQALYGSFCSIVPPFMSLRESIDRHWSIDQFEWADPVGDTKDMDLFLRFRKEKMDKLLA